MSEARLTDVAARERIATDLDHDLLVAAGAGSGKTSCLVERYLRLLAAGHEPARVVVVTFTRKAAAEMKQRVRERLLADGRRRLANEVEDAPVETMDAFCVRLLRGEALELGLDPGFELADEASGAALANETLAGVVRAALAAGDEAATALLDCHETFGGLVELLAAAVAQRRAWRDPFDESGEPLLAYLRGEADEAALPSEADLTARLEEAVAAALAAARADLLASPLWTAWQAAWAALAPAAERASGDKFHPAWELGERLLRRLPETPLLELVEALDEFAATKLTGGSGKLWGAAELAAGKQVVKDLRAWRKGAAVLDRDPAGEASCVRATRALWPLLRTAAAALRAAKVERGVLVFDDLLLEVAAALQRPALLARWRGRYERVLVDEYQDSNFLQDAVFRTLADPRRPGAFFAVGDDKQSIYAFRQAQVEVFNRARRLAGEGLVSLTTTFRLTPPLAAVLNRVFGEAAAMGPEPHAEPSAASFAPLCAVDKPVAAGAPVRLLLPELDDGVDPAWAEAEALAADLVASGRRPGECAILLRATTRLAAVREALLARGVPVRTDRGALCRRQEALDLLALARWLVSPRDGFALATLLRSPLVGLSDDDLCDLAREQPLVEAVAAAPGDELRLMRVRAWQVLLATHPLAEVLRLALDDSDYLAVLAALPDPDRRLANVEALCDLVARLERGGATPAQVVANLEARREGLITEDPEGLIYDPDDDAVSLLTVHGAKGLEWPVVYLPDLCRAPRSRDAAPPAWTAAGLVWAAGRSEDRWYVPPALDPRRRPRGPVLEFEQERLLYVACTRAKEQLVCVAALGAKGYAEGSWLAALAPGLGFDPDSGSAGAGVAVERPALAPSEPAPWPRERLARLLTAGPAEPSFKALTAPAVEQASKLRLPPPATFRGQRYEPSPSEERLREYMSATRRGDIVHTLLAAAIASRRAPSRDHVVIAAAGAGILLDEGVPGRDEVVGNLHLAACHGWNSGPVQQVLAMPLVLAEEPLAVRAGQVLLEGRADLVGVSDEELLLVDFKTGSPARQRQWEYVVETCLYAWMLDRRFPGRRVRLCMPLVDLGEVLTVEEDWREVAERALAGVRT